MKAILDCRFSTRAALVAALTHLFPLDPQLARAESSLPDEFNPGAGGGVQPGVSSLAAQADGKILVGGWFTTLGGQPRESLGRLNADGTLDSGFSPWANCAVSCLAAQADGKTLVGGVFTTLCGQPRESLGRLNADGTLDSGFNPGAGDFVHSLAVQADGKILVGGDFSTLCGQPRDRIGRLNADGTLDTGFNPGAGPQYSQVSSLAVQADGKILVGGGFTRLGGQPPGNVSRLNADGTPDSGFNPEASGGSYPYVHCLAVQADGKILVGGRFTTLGGQLRDQIGRLNNTEPAAQSLCCDGSSITWLRGGASPEVWRTTFEVSTNGTDWTLLGSGTRLPGLPVGEAGGWGLSGVNVPVAATLRARGYVAAGFHNGSGWFVESLLRVGPAILTRDGAFGLVSNQFGFNFRGLPRWVTVVEGSMDLWDWLPLQTNMLGLEPLYFTDPDWGRHPQRFYRVRVE